MIRRWLNFLFCIVISCTPLQAKNKEKKEDLKPKKLGDFGDWRAFVSYEEGKKICYMLSFPKTQEGDYKKRGKPYLMVTHRPEDQSFNVLSVHAGYKFSKEKKPTLIVTAGKIPKEFELFVEGEAAWALSDEMDQEITKMIIKTGQKVTVKGQSIKATKTVDTYSLTGSFGAYKAICEACSLKADKIL